MTVLILSRNSDDHATHMRDTLLNLGQNCLIWNPLAFPQEDRIDFIHETQIGFAGKISGQAGFTGRISGQEIDFSKVKSIYWRNYSAPYVGEDALPDHDQRRIAMNDSRSLVESLLGFESIKWVNGWKGFRLHQTKPLAMHLVSQAGVTVPETLVSNSPQKIREFLSRYSDCIFKPVQGGAHTRSFTEDDFEKIDDENLRLTPITLQRRIEGTNVRVFVIGQKALGLQIDTEAVDFRDDKQPSIKPIALPKKIEAQALKIAEVLHLCWTGIDYRVDSKGNYFYLEANPSPMFIGFEKLSGVPLSRHLAEFLIS